LFFLNIKRIYSTYLKLHYSDGTFVRNADFLQLFEKAY